MSHTEKNFDEKCFDAIRAYFEPNGVNLFEYSLALIHGSGIHGAEQDPMGESRQMLRDLAAMQELDLPSSHFRSVERTRWRLRLLAYAHALEMNGPYEMLCNLARIRGGLAYTIDPFERIRNDRDPNEATGKKRALLSPSDKIGIISRHSRKAKLPNLKTLFDLFYVPRLRNAIDHSDYAIEKDRLHTSEMIRQQDNVWAPFILFDKLRIILSEAETFYTTFFELERQGRAAVGALAGRALPYDHAYKGLIEFRADKDGLLTGCVVHWPNATESIISRSPEGCMAQNVHFERDGSYGLMVGMYASTPGNFSPLVEHNAQPIYTCCAGEDTPPSWPEQAE